MDAMNSKSEARNPKQCRITEIQNPKQYDLEERTLKFAKSVRDYLKKLPRNMSNHEISKQLLRSAGSVGANYIEANEALGKKDFIMRIKISRKEAKECIYWLHLTEPFNVDERTREKLIDEARQLMNIFGSIFRKCQ